MQFEILSKVLRKQFFVLSLMRAEKRQRVKVPSALNCFIKHTPNLSLLKIANKLNKIPEQSLERLIFLLGLFSETTFDVPCDFHLKCNETVTESLAFSFVRLKIDAILSENVGKFSKNCGDPSLKSLEENYGASIYWFLKTILEFSLLPLPWTAF